MQHQGSRQSNGLRLGLFAEVARDYRVVHRRLRKAAVKSRIQWAVIFHSLMAVVRRRWAHGA